MLSHNILQLIFIYICCLQLFFVATSSHVGRSRVGTFIEMEAHISPDTLFSMTKNLTFEEKGILVFEKLYSLAETSQVEVRKVLSLCNITWVNLWIQNSLYVKDDDFLVENSVCLENLKQVKGIYRIYPNQEYEYHLHDDVYSSILDKKNISDQDCPPNWGLSNIGATNLHNKGVRGAGIVVGVLDTGVDFMNPVLKNSYRGLTSSGTFRHDYSWLDTAEDARYPRDGGTHGTAVTGVVASSTVGVAPDSKWIHCRMMSGSSAKAGVLKFSIFSAFRCLQFMLAPTDISGNRPDVAMRPHIINCSWGGGSGLDSAMGMLVAAGVMVSKSAGNSGPACSSITYPGELQLLATVGGSDSQNNLYSMSSRGPAQNRSYFKPDFVMPAVDICLVKAYGGGSYSVGTGTSFASPHFAGAVALLWGSRPQWKGQVQETIKIFQRTASPKPSSECSSSGVPNNVFGYGIANVERAYQSF